ncbi:MAG: translation elongation factor 4 [Actinomycetota bacterium]|nr:translation elongation factor 4 [Actinomycetota bacterium]
MTQKHIRNFSIIAHIDHGKSTLADRLLEATHTITEREMVDQVLDSMDLERERGITIKARAVRINYRARDGQDYILNLIDTPGHVDFTYEVSRSLAACEGALLVVDAAQGVEAQTLANAFLALENNLEIIPVINKIDLPSADPARVAREIEESLAIDASNALLVSAKTGEGTEEVLEAIVKQIPEPKGNKEASLKALIFDSLYDPYRGVIVYIRVVDGSIKKGQKIRMMATGRVAEVEEVGVLRPDMQEVDELSAGEVGYVIAGIKEVRDSKVGDTITDAKDGAAEPLPGYREAKPMVFCGLYPVDGNQYEDLRDALSKLQLNDPALVYEPETSSALGFGFRCGFLGLLHMEIIKERLEREYDLELVATSPSVAYRVTKTNGEQVIIRNPSEMPQPHIIEVMEEPFVSAVILLPSEYVGTIMELCQDRRGIFKNMQYLSENRVELQYEIPLAEILFDFFNQLKSRTRGYASLDYEHSGYKVTELVKLDILLAGNPVDAFSCIVPKDKAYRIGRDLVAKLREIIPRQMFEVVIQAAIGSKIIARESIKAKRKDVLAKCYGGDVTRKRKLLERQKEGKRRMKQIGRVEVPQEAFMQVLQVEEKKNS